MAVYCSKCLKMLCHLCVLKFNLTYLFKLGTLVPLTTQPYVTTSVSPTYSYGPVDFQAANLLNSNNILKSPESYTVTMPD